MPQALASFCTSPSAPLAVVLGTNEIASAVAVLLTVSGYPVIMSHDPFPPVIRRGMAFHDALFGEAATVEGIAGERAESAWEIAAVLTKPQRVAVTPLHLTDLFAVRAPQILIDARMQKHLVTPDYRGLARLTIGLGPNFAVGTNCDIAVETRPARSGDLVRSGRTDAADGVARQLGGIGRERFAYSPLAGLWRTRLPIGTPVRVGDLVGFLGGGMVTAPVDGILRGVARDGTPMPAGVKLLEIDPRGADACWTGIDRRGRTIAEATMQAIRLNAARLLEDIAVCSVA